MPGVDGSETDGDPKDGVITEYGEANPLIGDPSVFIGDVNDLELLLDVLITDGCPTMVFIAHCDGGQFIDVWLTCTEELSQPIGNIMK